MAEERILIEILPPASGFGSCGGFYTEGVGEYFCCWNEEKEPITEAICNNCPHDKSITRQEAIERIAKVFVNLYIEIEGTGITYTAKEVAEEVLNALLEVE